MCAPGAVATFRAQAGVDVEGRVVAGHAEQRRTCSATDTDHLTARSHRPRSRVTDEHDVGVGTIALFPTAEPAHPDHRYSSRGNPVPADVGADHRLQCAPEHRYPDRCKGRADLPHIEHAEQVGRGHPRQFAPTQCACGGNGARRSGRARPTR